MNFVQVKKNQFRIRTRTRSIRSLRIRLHNSGDRTGVLTFLLEGEVLCEVAALVIAAQQKQGGWVTQLQSPQVQHTLHI
jgi:hypothetical protein